MNARRPNAIELLEPRRLFAATVDSSNVLQVTGTGAVDFIQLTNDGTTVSVAINSAAAQTFTASTLAGYNVLAGDGNDTIVFVGVFSGAHANGEGGNDKLAGGDGNETLYGGAGKDQIDGGAGNDLLKGNGGNDKLFGNNGGDRLYGGLGNDYLDGGSSGDKLYGEGGTDTLLGQSGDDNLYAFDKTPDECYGGSGTDTGICDGADIKGSIENVAII
jgi:Ca2+-binding RTX toxin-like protein